MERNKLIVVVEVLEQEEAELLQELSHLRKRINSFKQKLSHPKEEFPTDNHQYGLGLDSNDGYDLKDAWVDKIAYFINREKRFLHSREMQEMLNEKEPVLDKPTLQKRVSSALNRLRGEGIAVGVKVGKTNHGVFWGSPNWLDENGNPKKEYQYNKNYLVESKARKRTIE